MKNMEMYGVQEMDAEELKKANGGWWQFVVGAIVGGAIYDAYKATATAILEYHIDTGGTDVPRKWQY